MYDWDTMLTDFDVKEAKRINDTLAPRPSTLDRIADALDSPKALAFYLGFLAGCFATVLTAAIWGTLL